MTLAHSPSIVTNGLVFAYDMANTKKSWKGAPTVNQFSIPTPDGSDYVTFPVNGTGTFQRIYTGTYGGYDIQPTDIVYKYVLGAAPTGCHYHGNDVTITAGVTATWSCDFYIDPSVTGYPVTNYLANFEGVVSGSAADPDTSKTGVWKSFTFSSTAGSTGLCRMLLYPGACGTQLATGGFILYKNPQVEFNPPGSAPTPFVAGTRYANNNLESTPSYPTWNILSGSSYSAGTLTFASGSYNSKAGWDLYKTYSGLSTATNYTWSALVKLGTATNLLVTMNNTSAWNTGPSAQFNLGQLSTSEFRRVSITGTTNTGSFNLHLGASANSELAATVQSGGTVFLQDVRLVLTGSQTALVDLTDNNTITVNNLTYNSDGTFSFNGSNSYVLSPTSSLFDTQVVTMESWCYPIVTAQNGFLFEKGNVNTQYSNFFNGDGTFYFRTMGVSSQDLTFASASYITDNTWNHIVCTYGNGTKTIYVNGVQIAQATGITGSLPTGQNGQWVGINGYAMGYPFFGKIGVSKVYNRVLSDAEVLQNFNALRGRYGL